ncbi:ribonuclease H [Mesorhizobium sp. BR1-1-4]|uniref:ribonuclease H family protein n=1 Tax=Mesorhizobium sp. BR1-1-4 TaxID=2876650 RepID=UPI001CCB3C39|nr:ribonuclease H [Mesorhizobium sp. BR1-1-4]MBZ9926805.1 ribonuclease HI [Mesorhizobium sp. BR1-1-4]
MTGPDNPKPVTFANVTKRLQTLHHDDGLVVYADGACEPNPGAGGWGFVAYHDGVEVHCESGGEADTTNQRMELTAALQALLWLSANQSAAPVARLFSDSKYTVDGCNDWRHSWKAKGWKRGGPNAGPQKAAIANLDLWKALDLALTTTPITLEWVRGHSGVIGNERADELSLLGRADALPPAMPTSLDMIRQQLRYEV